MPLQYIESAAWCDQGFRMYWPSVMKLMGIRLSQPGTSAVLNLDKISAHPLCDLQSNKPWSWFSTSAVIKAEKTNPPAMRIVFRGIVEKLIQNYGTNQGKGEATPHLEDIASKREFEFDVAGNITPWPPRKARMSLVIRLFSRAFNLHIFINGQGPISLTNAPFLSGSIRPSANMPATEYSIPIYPEWIKQGTNILTISTLPCPGERANAALSLRSFTLWAK